MNTQNKWRIGLIALGAIGFGSAMALREEVPSLAARAFIAAVAAAILGAAILSARKLKRTD